MEKSAYKIMNGVYMFQNKQEHNLFEEHYMALRTKENRVYTNEQLVKLPDISPAHVHYQEWVIRKKSLQRLTKYLRNKKKSLKILEVGCGNGWLSHQLSKLEGSEVTGLDINYAELQQAADVFSNLPNIVFMYSNILTGMLEDIKFDIIVFAASVQYFQSLEKIINASLQLLSKEGEIHILDTHFYKSWEADAAKKRTLQYYQSFGFPEMADHYFHHIVEELQGFNYKLLHDPHLFINKVFRRGSRFPWLCIRKSSIS